MLLHTFTLFFACTHKRCVLEQCIQSNFVPHRCTEQATNKVVVTTIEELDLDANAMSAAAAQGIMLLESDNAAAAGEEADNGKQRKNGGGGGDGKSKFIAESLISHSGNYGYLPYIYVTPLCSCLLDSAYPLHAHHVPVLRYPFATCQGLVYMISGLS